MDHYQVLQNGAAILEPLFTSHGWTFSGWSMAQEPSLLGRGPRYYVSTFHRAARSVELQFRSSLGPVSYHVGEAILSHEGYLDYLEMPKEERSYPGFSENPIDEFEHLRLDLQRFLSEFLQGDAQSFEAGAVRYALERQVHQRDEMAAAVGDRAARLLARELFRKRDYAGVVAVLERLKFPEVLDDSEIEMLTLARRRTCS